MSLRKDLGSVLFKLSAEQLPSFIYSKFPDSHNYVNCLQSIMHTLPPIRISVTCATKFIDLISQARSSRHAPSSSPASMVFTTYYIETRRISISTFPSAVSNRDIPPLHIPENSRNAILYPNPHGC